MSLRVLRPGLLDSVQDGGRFGFQDRGVGPAGPADPLSHALANLLVGNPPDAAALEVTLRGPALRFEVDAVAAFVGAPFALGAGGRRAPRGRTFLVRAGTVLDCGEAAAGLRGYLAVAGGLSVEPVLGSRSTDLRGGFGGLEGRALRGGDELPFGPPAPEAADLPARARFGGEPCLALRWRLPWPDPLPDRAPSVPLGFVPGPQWPDLGPESRAALAAGAFKVGAASDRMGLRLQGPELVLAGRTELLSAPVATGTLQLPPDGRPILLLADRQTTGGYPRLGELATVDLPWAAQARPGSVLRLVPVEAVEARRRLRERTGLLDQLGRLMRRALAEDGRTQPCDWT